MEWVDRRPTSAMSSSFASDSALGDPPAGYLPPEGPRWPGSASLAFQTVDGRPGAPDPTSRRALLRKAAAVGGLLWAVPTIDSFVSVAAASSGTTTATLFKTVSGNQNPPLTSVCTSGALTSNVRGAAVWTRSEGPATICVTVTLSNGTSTTGRDVYILQSSTGGCLAGTVTPVGSWAATPAAGPQTFCTPIVSGATRFVVALQLSGGAGNDSYASSKVILP